MGGDIKVGISLSLRGARDVAQATREIERQIRETEGRFRQLTESGKLSQKQLGEAATAMREKVAASRREIEKLEDTVGKTAVGKYAANIEARRTLGIRAEVDIQREIKKTEAAYQRLVSSGVLSAQQQGRAFDAMKQKVTALNAEMGKLTATQKAYSGLKFGAAAAAGIAAAAYTLKAPAMAAMSFDERLAHMANTAFSGQRDAGGRKMGMKTLEAAINKARREGGGTREQAAGALDTMIASNAVSVEDAIKILPTVVKQAKAADADPNEIALTAVRAMQTFGIKAGELEAVMSGAQVAGQKGSFELKNMAHWLPEQMAMAKGIGISGKGGFAKLTAWNEAAAITAGTKDQAGNNLRDLLNEVNTPHFRKTMSESYLADGRKAKKGEKERLAKNLDAVYLDYQERGVNKIDATVDMMNTIFGRNKKFQELQSQLKGLGDKDPKRKEIVESMLAQVQGVATGKVFHNQQSLMALLGLMGNADVAADVERGALGQYTVPADKLESRISHSVIAGTAGFQVEQAGEDAKTAQKKAMDQLTPAIGLAAKGFSAFAQEFPVMTAAVVGAVPPLFALAGASGLAAIAMGGKLPGGAAITRAASALGGPGLLAFGTRALGGVGASAAVGYGAGSILNWLIDKGVQAGTGDKTQTLGGWIYDKLLPDSPLGEQLRPPAAAPKMTADVNVSVSDDRVSVKSTKMTATGMTAHMNTGNVMNGAP